MWGFNKSRGLDTARRKNTHIGRYFGLRGTSTLSKEGSFIALSGHIAKIRLYVQVERQNPRKHNGNLVQAVSLYDFCKQCWQASAGCRLVFPWPLHRTILIISWSVSSRFDQGPTWLVPGVPRGCYRPAETNPVHTPVLVNLSYTCQHSSFYIFFSHL